MIPDGSPDPGPILHFPYGRDLRLFQRRQNFFPFVCRGKGRKYFRVSYAPRYSRWNTDISSPVLLVSRDRDYSVWILWLGLSTGGDLQDRTRFIFTDEDVADGRVLGRRCHTGAPVRYTSVTLPARIGSGSVVGPDTLLDKTCRSGHFQSLLVSESTVDYRWGTLSGSLYRVTRVHWVS